MVRREARFLRVRSSTRKKCRPTALDFPWRFACTTLSWDINRARRDREDDERRKSQIRRPSGRHTLRSAKECHRSAPGARGGSSGNAQGGQRPARTTRRPCPGRNAARAVPDCRSRRPQTRLRAGYRHARSTSPQAHHPRPTAAKTRRIDVLNIKGKPSERGERDRPDATRGTVRATARRFRPTPRAAAGAPIPPWDPRRPPRRSIAAIRGG